MKENKKHKIVKLERAKRNRKCHHCGRNIYKNELCMVVEAIKNHKINICEISIGSFVRAFEKENRGE